MSGEVEQQQKVVTKIRQKPVATFAMVAQSYEDKDVEQKPGVVLVPTHATNRKIKRPPQMRFGEDLTQHEEDQMRMNLRMADDDVDDRIFEDEVEEEFDTDWVKQMMTGEGVIDEDEEYEEFEEDDDYPVHTERRGLERQFDRMMDEFEYDQEIEEDDPRIQGPMSVMDYAPALEQFAYDDAGPAYMGPGDGSTWRRQHFVDQMHTLATEYRVFDSNADGEFLVVLDGDKRKRAVIDFANDQEELKLLTLAQLRSGQIQESDLVQEVEPTLADIVEPKPDKEGRMDCETILSTYTNVYNRPTVIAAKTKKMKLGVGVAIGVKKSHEEERKMQKEAAKHADPTAVGKRSPAARPTTITAGTKKPGPMDEDAAAGPSPSDDEAADLFDDLPDEALPTMMDLSTRPKDENADEKKLRRALVKELQRERRAEKKSMRTAYTHAGIKHASAAARAKMDTKQMTMSVVRATT